MGGLRLLSQSLAPAVSASSFEGGLFTWPSQDEVQDQRQTEAEEGRAPSLLRAQLSAELASLGEAEKKKWVSMGRGEMPQQQQQQ